MIPSIARTLSLLLPGSAHACPSEERLHRTPFIPRALALDHALVLILVLVLVLSLNSASADVVGKAGRQTEDVRAASVSGDAQDLCSGKPAAKAAGLPRWSPHWESGATTLADDEVVLKDRSWGEITGIGGTQTAITATATTPTATIPTTTPTSISPASITPTSITPAAAASPTGTSARPRPTE